MISVTNLVKTFGNFKAVDSLSFEVRAGDVVGFLGPNGAGKSTMINIMAGLVRKTSGRVTIWGFDQDVNPRQSRAAIGIMPQEPNLDPFFSPRGSLDVQAGLYGVPRAQRRTDALLDLIGLTDKADAYARSLSGGMRRRLLLGKALVHDPQILVLDEPTAGVDIELRNQLWDNVRDLNNQGKTSILTTHYLEEAEAMCDEIAIINHGDMIVRDTTANLLGTLDRKTLLITPEGTPELPDMPDGIVSQTRDDGRLSFTYQASRVPAQTILSTLQSAGIVIRDVTTEQADLEDVFLSLTSSET